MLDSLCRFPLFSYCFVSNRESVRQTQLTMSVTALNRLCSLSNTSNNSVGALSDTTDHGLGWVQVPFFGLLRQIVSRVVSVLIVWLALLIALEGVVIIRSV